MNIIIVKSKNMTYFDDCLVTYTLTIIVVKSKNRTYLDDNFNHTYFKYCYD